MKKEIAILMSSKDDYEIMQHTESMLKKFEISYEIFIMSPHYELNILTNFIQNAKYNGYKIIITSSGSSAPYLPSIIASMTELPILAVPIENEYLKGLDSIIPILQNPIGVAIGIMPFGELGAKNAAILAKSILLISVQTNWHKEQTVSNTSDYNLDKISAKITKHKEYNDTKLYKQAVDLLLKDGNVSISYIQRKLSIGFNRAAKIMDEMEKDGIVSTANNRGKRKLLIN